MKHKGYNNVTTSNGNSTAQKFKYNGQEYEESLGLNLYEMDVRQYDPTIARWTAIDPVIHHNLSTYNAFDNNPVYWADPSGADSKTTEDYIMDLWNRSEDDGYGWTYNGEGTLTSVLKPKKSPASNGGLGYEVIGKGCTPCKEMAAFFKSLFGMADNDIRELSEDGNFQAADRVEKKNNETKKEAAKALGTMYTTATFFDPFGGASITRLTVAFDSEFGVNGFYNGFNSTFGTDYGAVSDGVFGLIGILTMGSGGGSGPASSLWSNGRVFWVGDGSQAFAQSLAQSRGLKTLDMMWYGKMGESVSKYLPLQIKRKMWDTLSYFYAKGSTGTVYTVFGTQNNGFRTMTVGSRSVWRRVEWKTLTAQGNNWVPIFTK